MARRAYYPALTPQQLELFEANRCLAINLAKRYFARNLYSGYEIGDYVSQALIGLFKAARDFDSTHGCSFGSFATIAINRQLQAWWKAIRRNKQQALNQSTCLDETIGTGELVDSRGPYDDPAAIALGRISYKALLIIVGCLCTDLEYKALIGKLEGASYVEIATELGTKPKAIDNALERVKKKARGMGLDESWAG